MNTRSKILYILAFIAILVYILKDIYNEVNAIHSVKYKIENLHVETSNNDKDVKISLDIAFYNNTEYEFTLQNLRLDILNNDKVKLGEIKKEKIIVNTQKTTSNVIFNINKDDISLNISQLLTSKDIYIYAEGNVKYKVSLFRIPITVQINEQINVKDEILKLVRKSIGF